MATCHSGSAEMVFNDDISGFDHRFGHPGIFSRPGKNSLSLKQLPGPGKDPEVAFTQRWP